MKNHRYKIEKHIEDIIKIYRIEFVNGKNAEIKRCRGHIFFISNVFYPPQRHRKYFVVVIKTGDILYNHLRRDLTIGHASDESFYRDKREYMQAIKEYSRLYNIHKIIIKTI